MKVGEPFIMAYPNPTWSVTEREDRTWQNPLIPKKSGWDKNTSCVDVGGNVIFRLL